MAAPTRDRTVSANTDITQYDRWGHVVLEGALSPDEVAELNAEAARICRGELGTIKGAEHARSGESDEEVMRRFLCIHFPHKMSQVMADALAQPRIVEALTTVIGPDVKAMQSMLFIKSEGKPGQAWHQDEFFIPTRDRSLTAAWIALDDATIENGCLWVQPGSHAPGIIYPDREHDDERFDCSVELYDFPYRDKDAVPVEMKAGSALIFNGYLLHRSLPNSGKHGFRRALANHYMSAQSLLPWRPPREDEHMAKTDDRDIVLVAGKDPYAYKGLDERHRPHIRRDRDGGCDR
ncbi:MAG TPA: phytanoyl-CoA dioxygenase family protein [Mycobacteriales bacterium]|nr:phytanoyl-CoA dioxygenase family protein [Mycobacteriales bacterium]